MPRHPKAMLGRGSPGANKNVDIAAAQERRDELDREREEAARRRQDREGLESRIGRSPGGAEFLARMSRLGRGGRP